MIDKNILYPLFLAFAISVALSPFIIPFLQRLKRTDHPDQRCGDVSVFHRTFS